MIEQGTPHLVTCIMPTRDRRRFVAQAIWYFLRQDYPSRELLILDDGEDRVADLVPSDERIRYVELPRGLSIGAKRNIGCDLARGGLIAHWDDDDWHAPDRLSVQVSELVASGADVCGATSLLHYMPMSGQAWRYRPASNDPLWLAGGTLLYRRGVWEAGQFLDTSIGEDTAFVARLASDRVRSVDEHLYVAVVHGANTAIKRLSDPRWERRPLDEVANMLALDRAFYVGLRTGVSDHGVLSRAASSITVVAPLQIYDGYGSMAEFLVLGMSRAGAHINVVPLGLDLRGMSGEIAAIVRASRPEPFAPILYACWPRPELERFRNRGDLFFDTMWESSRLPADWPSRLNEARAVLVPTRFVADVCRQSGVTVPIEVVPLGLDPSVYHYEDRPERDGLTTLMVGPVAARKHSMAGIAAWKQAFSGDSQARLIIKARFGYGNYVPDDPRITFVDSNETTRGIPHWYRQADVLLALGNEGFGLPLVEGMATGLPVVALASEGQGDVCTEVPELVLGVNPASWEPCNDSTFGECGRRGVPKVEDVAERLRWVAEHRPEAKDLGAAASEWAVGNRNVWRKGPAVLDAMERYVKPPRSLRRTRTIWTPSLGTPCGISEYTAYLASSMPANVQITARRPNTASLRLLHVQHEYALFGEADLTACAQEARQAGVPVLVTEHTVTPFMSAWEREADALLAATIRGASILRQRWPGKEIHHMPHGCPTWFPPRKTGRGAVVAAFGFLAPHKGFWKLLDALRAIPGAELLLFSHARSAELEASWNAAAAGLPVRRIEEFLPIEDVACRLAAEADVIAFWYDEVPNAAASLAARVGLATGVPVLTSRTRWFEGLEEATHQPDDLADGIRRLLEDTALRVRLVDAAREYCHENSWEKTATRHVALWETLEAA